MGTAHSTLSEEQIKDLLTEEEFIEFKRSLREREQLLEEIETIFQDFKPSFYDAYKDTNMLNIMKKNYEKQQLGKNPNAYQEAMKMASN